MSGLILSADIGTSSLKAALIDFDGHLLAFDRTVYRRNSAGQIDAEAWELAFAKILESLKIQAGGRNIDGICISGNGPTLVPLNMAGQAMPPLYWYDGKIALPAEVEAQSFFLPYTAWFKTNSPEKYEKVKLFISSHEWLASRLGADLFTSLPSQYYESYYWDERQLRLYGLDNEKFPPFVKMGTVVGKVSQEAARTYGSLTGLKSGIPIIAGGPDFISALIGTGTREPGDVCDRAGSSEGINVCVKPPLNDKTLKKDGFRLLPHAVEGLWNIGALIPSSGKLFEWFRTNTGQENRDYAELLSELIPSSDSPSVFRDLHFSPLPQLSKEPKLIPSHSSKLNLGRTVLCTIAFSVRSALKKLTDSGYPVKEMRVSGGQGKSRRWNQLKADICGVSLLIPEINDGELAGNAIIASASLGGEKGRAVRFRELYHPNPENRQFWEEIWVNRGVRNPVFTGF